MTVEYNFPDFIVTESIISERKNTVIVVVVMAMAVIVFVHPAKPLCGNFRNSNMHSTDVEFNYASYLIKYALDMHAW